MSDVQKKELLIEFILQDVVAFILEDQKIDIEEAMYIFYNSSIFNKLHDIETGLYLESSAYIYEILKDEVTTGELKQKEE